MPRATKSGAANRARPKSSSMKITPTTPKPKAKGGKRNKTKQQGQNEIMAAVVETAKPAEKKKHDLTSPELLRDARREVGNRMRLLTPNTKSELVTVLFTKKKEARPDQHKIEYGDWGRMCVKIIVAKHGVKGMRIRVGISSSLFSPATAQEIQQFKISLDATKLIRCLSKDSLHLHMARSHGLLIVEWLGVFAKGFGLYNTVFTEFWLYIARKVISNDIKYNLVWSDPRLLSALKDMTDQAVGSKALELRSSKNLTNESFVAEFGEIMDFLEPGWGEANGKLILRPDLFTVDSIRDLNIVTRLVGGKFLYEPQLRLVRLHRIPRSLLEHVTTSLTTVAAQALSNLFRETEEYCSDCLGKWEVSFNQNVKFVMRYRGYLVNLDCKPAQLLLVIVRGKFKEYLSLYLPIGGDDVFGKALGSYEKFSFLDIESTATDKDAVLGTFTGELVDQVRQWRASSAALSQLQTLSECLKHTEIPVAGDETALLDRALYETLDSSKIQIQEENLVTEIKKATSVADLKTRLTALKVSRVCCFFGFHSYCDECLRAVGALENSDVCKIPTCFKDSSDQLLALFNKTSEELETTLTEMENSEDEPTAIQVKGLMCWAFAMSSVWSDRLLPYKKKLASSTVEEVLRLHDGDVNGGPSSSSSSAAPLPLADNQDDEIADLFDLIGGVNC